MEILLHHWWIALCPAAGITLLPVWAQITTGAVALAAAIGAVWYARRTKPVEVVECQTTQNTSA